MLPSKYSSNAQIVRFKKQVAKLQHFSAPIKGLDLSSKLTVGDQMTATILDNWVIDEDKIRVRPGTFLVQTLPVANPIEMLIPFYGSTTAMLAATNGTVYDRNNVALKTGFTSGNWSFTSFANLGQEKFTICANGKQGVWAWDGGVVVDPAAVSGTLSHTNPATIVVAPADIGKFKDGMNVYITGATGAGMVNANGTKLVMSVNVPANTMTLPYVDTSTGTADQAITVNPTGSFAKQAIYPPAGATHVIVDNIDKVLSHMNRLWFADQSNLSIYYLPLQQKTGELVEVQLNAIFKRGGSVRAIHNWTVDGGSGLDDKLVIFSSNGEAAIYSGVDPENDMQLVGVFRFDSPQSMHCVANIGGDLFVLTSTGLLPMTTLIRAESEQLGQAERNVVTEFRTISAQFPEGPRWQLILDQNNGRAICNMPLGALNKYRQMVRQLPKARWSSWSALPSRCWQWLDGRLYIGSDDGRVYEVSESYFSDDGVPIVADVQMAWSMFKSPNLKQFKMILPYIITDGFPQPYVDMQVDYDFKPPINQPEMTSQAGIGAVWDEADWDTSDWAGSPRAWNNWTGAKGLGRVGAPRLRVTVNNCMFGLSGWDVLYEEGSVFG